MTSTMAIGDRAAHDAETFRAEMRGFLEANPLREFPNTREGRLDQARGWARTLAEHGWAAPAWPQEYGGMGLPLELQVIYHEEMTKARVPGHPDTAVGMVGPTLIRHGTDHQRERFLSRILRADDLWCQGFSEPEAGSDLPALRTRAVRDGDVFVVDGQKVWTTNAMIANWCFALVRTGPESARQDAISYLLIDMESDGVEIRPLRDMTGMTHFAETFFTSVRVPVGNLVGEENGGWHIARTTLGHERSSLHVAQSFKYRRIVTELHELGRTTGAADDPVVRQRLADIEIAFQIYSLNGQRTLSMALATGQLGPVTSVSRLHHSLFEQKLHEVAVSILGANAMLYGDPHSVQGGRWVRGFLHTRASTIGGGTSEIQRNTIAEQVLGLPRDPAMPSR